MLSHLVLYQPVSYGTVDVVGAVGPSDLPCIHIAQVKLLS